MSSCNHDCKNCEQKCSKEGLLAQPNKRSRIKKIIAIASGKGGVGKSLVTSLLAVAMNKEGYKIGILDADITGPSIPKAFNTLGHVQGCEDGMLPNVSANNIKIISANNLIESSTTPICWRGSMISGAVKQFYSDVCWEDVDYLFVDMPPGTGDVPLTVYQSLPIDGVIIVSSPQDLVKMIVEKAIKMANMMDVKILGLLENMSYIKCPCCDEKIQVFGESKIDEIAKEYHLNVLAKLPIENNITKAIDNGTIENVELPDLSEAIKVLKELNNVKKLVKMHLK